MAELEPQYVALAKSLIKDIEAGRLQPGAKLPGSRGLAQQLGLSRNTVLAAYQDLVAQGWIETRPASGTYVRREIAGFAHRAQRRPAAEPPQANGFELRGQATSNAALDEQDDELLNLSTGMPDSRLAPSDLIARAYGRVLRARGEELLKYADPRGEPSLRRELADYLSRNRGMNVDPSCVLITRGSQMAMALASTLVLRRGDKIAVERYGYVPMWHILRQIGAEVVPIEVDEHGMVVEDLVTQSGIRAVYLTPHHQYPTMAVLAPERRKALLTWARRRAVAVIEDDYDHEFHFEGRPVAPLFSADSGRNVLYCGSLSKILAPGLRIGFLVASQPVIERAASLRMCWDRQGDAVTESAIAQLLAMGEVARHARKVSRMYAERRRVLLDTLGSRLSGVLLPRKSHGGMTVWAQIVDGTDPTAWAAAAANEGAKLHTAADYDFYGEPAPYVRLSFAAFEPHEIDSGVELIRGAWRHLHP